MAVTKKSVNNKCREDVEKLDPSYNAGGKTVWQFLKS